MRKKLFTVAFLLCAGTILAQSAPTTTAPSSATEPAGRRGEPCWQQAGIEKSVAQEIWSIGRDVRSQVDGVCSNSSLTPQQKRQQVQGIRQEAMQKREALVTADQQKTFMACQQARSGNNSGEGGPHEGLGGGGGCGATSRYGSRPNGASNGAQSNVTSNMPQPNQSSPQN